MTAVTIPCFSIAETCVKVSEHWFESRDADPVALEIYLRHYSARPNGESDSPCFVGPGEKIVLLTGEATALFIWRWEKKRDDGQTGINCTAFRNESQVLSSLLIEESCAVAWGKWPGERLFTFIDAAKTRRKRDPGRCFRRAGWRNCGYSKAGLLIMEILPNG